MPFKGMLKWAVAKEDLKQSTLTSNPACSTASNGGIVQVVATSTASLNPPTPSTKLLKSKKKPRTRSHNHQQLQQQQHCILKSVAENNARNLQSAKLSPQENNKDVKAASAQTTTGEGGGVALEAERKKKKVAKNVNFVREGELSKGAKISEGAAKPSGKSGKLFRLKSDRKAMGSGQSVPVPGINPQQQQKQLISVNNNNANKKVPAKVPAAADSKSLLYMSLDHLPLAIVKQYERMLQETNEEEQRKLEKPEREKIRAKTAEDLNVGEVSQKRKKKTRAATVVVDTKDLINVKGIMKTGQQQQTGSGKKLTIISPQNNKQFVQPQFSPKITALPKDVSIKEAKSRPLVQVHKVESFRIENRAKPHIKRKTPSPENIPRKIREKCRETGRSSPGTKPSQNTRFKVTIISTPPATPPEVTKKDASVFTENKHFPLKSILKAECKSSTLPRAFKTQKPISSESTTSTSATSGGSNPDLSNYGEIPTLLKDHDLTDPQFLESPLPTFTPASSAIRCAKKLTLKRSELRKLERIRNQTEKLNRFLKKYYHDCLPNLPEEEEDTCSPENKSVHLSVLRQHWIEKRPEDSAGFIRRNTLPSKIPSIPLAADSTSPDNFSNLLSSSAYYSDPLLSALPKYFPQQNAQPVQKSPQKSRLLQKQKSCTNLLAQVSPTPKQPVPRATSVSSSGSSSSTCSCSSCASTSSTTGKSTSVCNFALQPEFRMAEVCRQDSQIHTSFLMSTHNFSQEDKNDNSLLALQERELLHRRSTNVLVTNNENATIVAESVEPGLKKYDQLLDISEASPAPVLDISLKAANLRVRNKSDSNNNNRATMDQDNNGLFACSGSSSSSNSSVNGDEKAEPELTPAVNLYRLENDDDPEHLRKLKGSRLQITGQPLAASVDDGVPEKNAFDVPPLPQRRSTIILDEEDDGHHEDEGFMSPYPPEQYSPSGSCSSRDEPEKQRLSLSSSGKGSAEDIEEEISAEETNLELFFLDSTNVDQGDDEDTGHYENLKRVENNYDIVEHVEKPGYGVKDEFEEDADEEGEYATLTGSSNSSTATYGSSTNSGVVCGAFFPKMNKFEVGSGCHQRQVSGASDSQASSYYVPNYSQSSEVEYAECRENFYDIPETKENIYDEVTPEEEEEEEEEEEPSVIIQVGGGLIRSGDGGRKNAGFAFSTPIARSKNGRGSGSKEESLSKTRGYRATPKIRKVLRRPRPVTSWTPYSSKGEVLLKCYRNGDYVTVHVVQARHLQVNYRSAWKLSMKLSLIPEGETTLTKSETVLVPRAKGSVRIDEKFSFELASQQKSRLGKKCKINKDGFGELGTRKVFLTFVKRIEKRSTFLGWITLAVPESQNPTQCWLKLRKRKMSSVSYSSSTQAPNSPPSTHHPHQQSHQHLRETSLPVVAASGGGLPYQVATNMVGLPSHFHPEDCHQVSVVASATMEHNNHNQYLQHNHSNYHGVNGVAIMANHQMMPQHGSCYVSSDEENNLQQGDHPHNNQYGNHHQHLNHHHHHHNHNDLLQSGLNNQLAAQYSNLLPGKISCQLQNSNTMDSGVEDCCEPQTQQNSHVVAATTAAASQVVQTGNHYPASSNHQLPPEHHLPPPPPEVPCIELDDSLGFRVRVHMTKPEGAGFGFSVVWVSPPRIERLEKDKTADVAGLKIGDLIIGVNGEDVTNVPNTTIYNKMKSTGKELDLEVWRKHPHAASPLPPHHMNVPNPINPAQCVPPPPGAPSTISPPPSSNVEHATATTSATAALPKPSSSSATNSSSSTNKSVGVTTAQTATLGLPSRDSSSTAAPPAEKQPPPPTRTTSSGNPFLQRILQAQQQQQNPTSILKPPQPQNAHHNHSPLGSKSAQQNSASATASSSWRIRFNIELLDNEDDNLKQFFICELKFFRKVVAALDRYLIPAQAKRLLTPQEIHLIFAQVIKIITMTKRILQCVANGSTNSTWKLGRILLSTHTDHLPDITSAYTEYARSLARSAMILSEKMSIQDFAKFVVETPVPKGHLDMTALLFAPFEHLRNLCEIAEEISHHHDNWVLLNTRLKECYAEIVCETDFMEPISHISMKKNPLLSVRDLEKRIISTTSQQPLKVCEKGRKWLFGSRLYRRENDGSWSPVWAFLFTDIIVLTSHMTRDRVFFVKEPPIRLDDVVTLHFNLPKKHENEFRLLFGPDNSHHSRLDRILPLVRSKKPNQVVLRTANSQLKSLWKLLLQRQIISLNTRLSKSSSSNFSISEFCEKFPVVQHDSIMEEDEDRVEVDTASTSGPTYTTNSTSHYSASNSGGKHVTTTVPVATSFSGRGGAAGGLLQKTSEISGATSGGAGVYHPGTPMPSVKKPIPLRQQKDPPRVTIPPPQEVSIKAHSSSGGSTSGGASATSSAPESRGQQVTSPTTKPYVPDGLSQINRDMLKSKVARRPSIPPSSTSTPPLTSGGAPANASIPSKTVSPPPTAQPPQHVDACTSTTPDLGEMKGVPYGAANFGPPAPPSGGVVPPVPKARTSLSMKDPNSSQNTPVRVAVAPTSASPTPSHNNNNSASDKQCPCEKMDKPPPEVVSTSQTTLQRETAYPSPKPRQLSALKRQASESPSSKSPVPPEVHVVAASPLVVKRQASAEVVTTTPSKSKPGPRIMTNATLKSRQQEIIATQQQQQAMQSTPPITTTSGGGTGNTTGGGTKPSISTETIRSECTTKTEDSSTQYFSLKEDQSTSAATTSHSTTMSSVSSMQAAPVPHPSPSSSSSTTSGGSKCLHAKNMVHHQHHAHHCPIGLCGGSPNHLGVHPPPRCQSENGHHPSTSGGVGPGASKNGKPGHGHTDSPLISGYGSERARRRLLFDNKLKKDYPELFGITPKDRRSFIKQLGETTEEVLTGGKALVAPYYYTLSPVPLPKHALMMTMQYSQQQQKVPGKLGQGPAALGSGVGATSSVGSGPLVIPPYNPNGKNKQSDSGSTTSSAGTSTSGTSGVGGGTGVKCRSGQQSQQPPQQQQQPVVGVVGGVVEGMRTSIADVAKNLRRMAGGSTSSQGGAGAGADDDEDNAGGGEILEVEINHHHHHDVYTASLELDAGADRLKEFVEKLRQEMAQKRGCLRKSSSEEIDPEEDVHVIEDDSDDEEEEEEMVEDDEDDDEEEEEEDSDDTSTQEEDDAEGHDFIEGAPSHRSHEESSNDSGISDEMTEKSKTTLSGLMEESSTSSSGIGTSGSGAKRGHPPPGAGIGMQAEVNNFQAQKTLKTQKTGGGGGGEGGNGGVVDNGGNDVGGEVTPKPQKLSASSAATSTESSSGSNSVHSTKLNVTPAIKNREVGPAAASKIPPGASRNAIVVDVLAATSCSSCKHSSLQNSSASCVSSSAIPVSTSGAASALSSHCSCDAVDIDKHLSSEGVDKLKNSLSKNDSEASSVFGDLPQGEAPGSVEALVVLGQSKSTGSNTSPPPPQSGGPPTTLTQTQKKLDKCTETKEEDFQFLHDLNADKPMKSILAERREAFFMTRYSSVGTSTSGGPSTPNPGYFSRQQTISFGETGREHVPTCCRSHFNAATSSIVAEPLKVKIVEGGLLQSTTQKEETNQGGASGVGGTGGTCERVQLQRLERQKKAKVERVESSEDSTSSSSDLASASPGGQENGTTDPSWSSSSSSSLAGYGSMKEEPNTSSNNTNPVVVSSSAPPLVRTTSVDVATSTNSGVPLETSRSLEGGGDHSVVVVVAPSQLQAGHGQSSSTTAADKAAGCEVVTVVQSTTTSKVATSSSSSTSWQESSTTSSKSYSLLLESDFSSFESIEPPSSYSTTSGGVPLVTGSTTSGGQSGGGGQTSSANCSSASSSKNKDSAKVTEKVVSGASTSGGESEVGAAQAATSGVVDDVDVSEKTSSSKSSGKKSGSSGGGARVVVVERGEGPEVVVTQESDEELEEDDDEEDSSSGGSRASTQSIRHGYSSDGEEDSIVCNGAGGKKLRGEEDVDGEDSDEEEEEGGGSSSINSNRSTNGSFKQKQKAGFLRVQSNDSTAEGEEDEEEEEEFGVDFEDEEEDVSHCSVATINRYGTFESLEKLESEDTLGELGGGSGCGGTGGRGGLGMPRSKARFTFEDEDDDEEDEDLFEEDFESDFNFRFPSQIQDNTYSVSRLGPLPPLLEEDFEDEMYDETRASGVSPSSSSGLGECSSSGGISGGGQGCSSSAMGVGAAASLRSRHETGLRRDNSFLLARLATMYARSSISPLKILRELWLKKSRQQPVPAPAPPPPCSYSSTTLQTSPVPPMAIQGIGGYHPTSPTHLQLNEQLQPPSQQKLVLIKSSNSQEMIFLAESTDPVVMMAVVPTMTPVEPTQVVQASTSSSTSTADMSTSTCFNINSSPPPPPPQFSDDVDTDQLSIPENSPCSADNERNTDNLEQQQWQPSASSSGSPQMSSGEIPPYSNSTPSTQTQTPPISLITENSPTNTSI